MIHNVRFIQRRFPRSAGAIVGALTAFSLVALALGGAMLLLR